MKSQDTQLLNELLKQLDAESDEIRLRSTLRMLNLIVLTLTLLALLIMLIPPFSLIDSYVIVSVSITVNILIEWLIRKEHANIGAYIFTIWTNFGMIMFLILSATQQEKSNLVMFAGTTPLFTILGGLLLGWRFAGILTITNLIIVFFVYFWFFTTTGTSRGVFEETTGLFIPVLLYSVLVWAAISFYQYYLTSSRQKLNQARTKLLQDQILRHDLEIARMLQQRLYPSAPPSIDHIQIVAYSEPARETSGDFYDFVRMPDQRWAIVVADVTGKSIAAAMVMVMARSVLRSYITSQKTPTAILKAANNALCNDGLGNQYVTVFLGILDPQTNTIQFATAGHPFPFLRRNGQIQEIGHGSLPLGTRLNTEYRETTLQLQAGDQIFLLTDGFFEVRNAQREIFGFERLKLLLNQIDPHNPRRALEQLLAAINQFCDQVERSDDMTALIIQVLPQTYAATATV
ncbi:PP2C family protein-serine/threonine phosphatase [Chloroflexus sp. Y-396-1]|uniref:PP2C family protein-serine/threonine phosphatase n=1 Tax=Chloroflexus sp. Y-396-1 TaxID=867845 RepID=UPI00048D052A|nr:PP2C family protein-serine/threonine phosphatase [Chloroflexus sp. Y-396-1]